MLRSIKTYQENSIKIKSFKKENIQKLNNFIPKEINLKNKILLQLKETYIFLNLNIKEHYQNNMH